MARKSLLFRSASPAHTARYGSPVNSGASRPRRQPSGSIARPMMASTTAQCGPAAAPEAGRGFAEPGAGSGGIGSAQRGAAARALDGPPGELTLNHEATVRRQHLAREVAAARPRQEERGLGDLARLAEPPDDGLQRDQRRLGGALLAEDVEQRR